MTDFIEFHAFKDAAMVEEIIKIADDVSRG